ncbi:MAG: PQQ-binding-like beta-propeller repeat protein [Candidatus Eremiobacteraeota bacterium]|nr:PQQ-binding-like beta-propeller repeat protein [Candidatus Eremiobacteraeota bacterium]
MWNIFKKTDDSDKEEKQSMEILRWYYAHKALPDDVFHDGSLYHDPGGTLLFTAVGDKELFTLAAQNGASLWKHSVKKGLHYAPSAYAYGSNFVTVTKQGNVQALDLENRKVAWEKKVETQIHRAPLGWDDVLLLFGEKDSKTQSAGHITALSCKDGALLWEKPFGVASAPLSHQDRVLIDSLDGFIYFLDLHSGEALWRYKKLEITSSIGASFSNDAVFVIENEHVYALLLKDGTLAWQIRINNEVCRGLAYNDHAIFFLARDGFVYSLNIERGSLIWKYQITAVNPLNPREYRLNPLLADDTLFIFRSDSLYGLGAGNGRLKCNKALNNEKVITIPHPVVLPGYVIFCDGRRNLFLFDEQKMKVLWQTELDKKNIVIVTMQSYEKNLYILSAEGAVFCLNMERIFASLGTEFPTAHHAEKSRTLPGLLKAVHAEPSQKPAHAMTPLQKYHDKHPEDHQQPGPAGPGPDEPQGKVQEPAAAPDLPVVSTPPLEARPDGEMILPAAESSDGIDVDSILYEVEGDIARQLEEISESPVLQEPVPFLEEAEAHKSDEGEPSPAEEQKKEPAGAPSAEEPEEQKKEPAGAPSAEEPVKAAEKGEPAASDSETLKSLKVFMAGKFDILIGRIDKLARMVEKGQPHDEEGSSAEKEAELQKDREKIDLIVSHVSHIFKYLQYLKQEVDAMKAFLAGTSERIDAADGINEEHFELPPDSGDIMKDS